MPSSNCIFSLKSQAQPESWEATGTETWTHKYLWLRYLAHKCDIWKLSQSRTDCFEANMSYEAFHKIIWLHCYETAAHTQICQLIFFLLYRGLGHSVMTLQDVDQQVIPISFQRTWGSISPQTLFSRKAKINTSRDMVNEKTGLDVLALFIGSLPSVLLLSCFWT